MGTTTEKLQAILDSKADIKDAIEQKGVEVGSTPLSGYAQKILDIPSGGGGEDEPYTDDAVRFFDYDGKQLLGMSKEDFLALDAMPANPATHEELVFTEWSHTLAEAKNYVSKYDYCDVMALYDTVDGNTRVTIRVDAGDSISIASTGGPTLDIDWGDGNVETFVNAANVVEHTYTTAGEYTIVIAASVKGMLGGRTLIGEVSNIYPQKIEISNKIISIYYGSNKNNCIPLKGSSLLYQTGGQYLNNLAIQGTYPISIKAIFITKFTHSYQSAFNARCVIFSNDSTQTDQRNLEFCQCVDRILLPIGLQTIPQVYSQYCYSARHIVIPDGITSIGSNAFFDCFSVKEINIPNSVTTIGGSAFYNCIAASLINLPEGLKTISIGAFYNCTCKEITIPTTVTNIGNDAFMSVVGNYNLTDVYIKPTTPPTISQRAFPTNLTYTMHVPQGTLAIYQGATNWKAYASIMVDDITE
jgi:hypothetical protein